MASGANGLSDERISEAVIQVVVKEELRSVSLEDEIPPLSPVPVENEQEQKIIKQLATMIRIIGDQVRGNTGFQDAIDSVAHNPSTWEMFSRVSEDVFADGITWEKIAVLIYVAGKLAVKMLLAHLAQAVQAMVRWTVNFFRTNLLGWIREQGGWINSFSELAVSSMRRVSVTPLSANLIVMFLAGVVVGGFATWRLSRGH